MRRFASRVAAVAALVAGLALGASTVPASAASAHVGPHHVQVTNHQPRPNDWWW